MVIKETSHIPYHATNQSINPRNIFNIPEIKMLRDISDDIQREIMNRLPVKSLIQFRSVCKEWKLFIDSSEFIAGYSHTQPQHLLIKYEVGDRQETEVKCVCFVDDDTFPQQNFALTVPPLLQLIKESRVIGSSGGLLFLDGLFRESDNSVTHMAVIWNPAIRKSIAVALPNEIHPVLGFGVCPYTNDPKLVRITNDSREVEVMVFTLSSGEWTRLSINQLPRKSIGFTWSQTVIGQFIYWVAYEGVIVIGEPDDLIMSFDMTTQEFREVDLPDSLTRSNLSVSRLRESLVLLKYNINFAINTQVCDVWMMEHGAFTKLFTINPPNASVWTLGFRKSGEAIVEMRDIVERRDYNKKDDTPSVLVVYEPCSEHIRDLGIHGNRCSFSASSYTESLLLLNHDDGRIIKCGAVKR